jgi:hypothetical protein
MKLVLLSTISFSISASLQAEIKDQIIHVGTEKGYYLALPTTVYSQAERDDQKPKTDCTALHNEFEPMMESIEKCGKPGAQTDQFCIYTKRIVRQKVLGIQSEITETRSRDAAQSWNVSGAIKLPGESDYQGLTSELAAQPFQVTKPVSVSAKIFELKIINKDSRIYGLLKALEIPETTDYHVTYIDDGTAKLNTTSRIISCEFENGNLVVDANLEVIGKFRLPSDEKQLTSLWTAYASLAKLAAWSTTKDSLRYVLTGYRLASMPQTLEEPTSQEAALFAAETLLDLNANKYTPRTFASVYELGTKLPQETVTFSHVVKHKGNSP